MTNGFAGSKSLDERRRRRLAQEGLEASGESPRASRRRLRASLFSRSSDSPQTEHSLQLSAAAPVKTRLWREPWKYWTLISLLLLVNIGTVAFAHRGMVIDGPIATPSVVNWIVDHLAIGYFGMTAAVTWLIFCHRSRSRLDFGGRYRLWLWPAAIWTGVTTCSLTGGHELFGDWLAGQTNLRGWNGPFWCWLVPASALMLSSTRLLTTEFIACRSAWKLHLTSLVPSLFAVVCVLLDGTSLDGAWRVPAVTLATILWPTLELGSFLLFARHVVHVTNEPTPVVRRRRQPKQSLRKLLKRFITWLLAPREELPAYAEVKAPTRARKKSSKAPARSKSRTSRKSSTKKSRVVERTDEDDDSEVDADDEVEAESPPARQAPVSAPVAPVRVDKPSVTATAKIEKPVVAPVVPPKPIPPAPVTAPRVDAVAKVAESRPGSQLRVDPQQAKRGPHFAQAQQREREAVAAMSRASQQMEDDFGDVNDWEDGEQESNRPQRKKMKGKKHRR